MQLGGVTTLQSAYDASADPEIVLAASPGSLTLRDAATPIGDVFNCESNAGVDFFNLDPLQMNFGPTARRAYEWNSTPTGKSGLRYLPDGGTITTAEVAAGMWWDSTVTSNIPGGAPFGNDTAPAMVHATGEVIFESQPLLLATSLLFNQATTITTQGFTIGPIYTMIHQPRIRVGSVGGSRSCSQMNAVRAQAAIGPNIAGNLTQTSVEYFYSLLSLDAAVGTVSCTTYTTLAQKAPGLLNGATIGTLNVIDIPNIPAAGITNIRGISSAMSNGQLVRHVGTAPVQLGGALQLGLGTAFDWSISRVAANVAALAAGDSLFAPGIVVAHGYDEITSTVSTTSATLVDVTGLTFDLTIPTGLPSTARIVANLSVQCSTTGGAPATGAWAISINSVDGTEIARYLSGTNDTGALGVQARSGSLGAGTYTVVARHRRVSGTSTVNTDIGELSAIAIAE
jgi:hypothetical protein